MLEQEEELGGQPPEELEQQSVWETLEELKRSNSSMKKVLGRQGLEIKAVHEAIEAIAQAQQEGQEKLAEYFEDLESEETTQSRKGKRGTNVSKRKSQEVELELDEVEEEGMSVTTKMALAGLAGFVAGSACTALYFKYGPGATPGIGQGAAQVASMQDLPRQVVQMR